jgi:cell division protein FtsI (penicillin-binding protein 3)
VKLIEKRVGLLFAVFTLAFCGVMARAAWLQAVKGGDLSAEATLQQTAAVTVPGIRGSILDRRGKGLAVSEDAATIFATPYQVEKPEKAAEKLSKILGTSPEKLLEIFSSDAGFEYIERQVSLSDAERVRALELPGIGILPDSRRVYPQGEIGARLIGATGTDGDGLFGIEASEEKVLGGTDGELAVTRDALGDEISRDTVEGSARGGDVTLTIDAKIQAEAEKVLAELGEANSPDGATAIAMNPDSGEILAMASWPPVDPSNLADAAPEDLSNMATGFTYEPGSTFKAFTVAGALEDKVVEPDTQFTLAPSIQLFDRVIEESHPRGTETMTVADILKVSSNVGAVTIGLELNGDPFGGRFDHWVRRFGFSKPTGIDFPGEERGILPSPKDYSGSTMGNLPLGQGLSVTPLQMMAGYGAIANGGRLVKPHLIESVNGETAVDDPGRQIISGRTARELRLMFQGVLEPGGTASVEIQGYQLAGKTGTAQKVVDGEYSDTQYVASFVGFAPVRDPEFLMAVIVDNPKAGGYYGGELAAPAFGEIASFALPYLGVQPN